MDEEQRARVKAAARPYQIATGVFMAGFVLMLIIAGVVDEPGPLVVLPGLACFVLFFVTMCVQGLMTGLLPARSRQLYRQERPRLFAFALGFNVVLTIVITTCVVILTTMLLTEG